MGSQSGCGCGVLRKELGRILRSAIDLGRLSRLPTPPFAAILPVLLFLCWQCSSAGPDELPRPSELNLASGVLTCTTEKTLTAPPPAAAYRTTVVH